MRLDLLRLHAIYDRTYDSFWADWHLCCIAILSGIYGFGWGKERLDAVTTRHL